MQLRKLAVGAVRLAAMSQFGPLAGGVFLTGGALAGKILAESDWAKAGADVITELVGGKAADLFSRAAGRFRDGRNGDIEESMRAAARQALAALKDEAPAEFAGWFGDWDSYLLHTPADQLFSGTGEADPIALQYDDDEFRALWWSAMEPTLLRWRQAADSTFTQLHLEVGARLPDPLRNLLRARLPEVIQEQHDLVLRDPKLGRSWVAFQQHVYRETLDHLLAIRSQLDRIERKLDGRAVAETVWTIPRPTQNFQDRPELIEQIDSALGRRGATALTALHGLGGIGKSQLARRYAQLRRDRYRLGAWIEAETTVSLTSSFSELAPFLGVPVEQDQQAMAARVINELSAREPWLVVFDNAVSAPDLREYVERLSGNGHVLITSRSEHWDGVAEPVSVAQWTVDESSRYLLDRTKQTDRPAAEGLADDLDGLVLALEHAAAYVRASEMSLAEYRRIWRKGLSQAPKGHEYPESVAAALALSLDRVRQESALAYDLLSLFAWLAPDRIPKKELLEAGAAKLPEALGKAFVERDHWGELIETLGRYSLVRRERADGLVIGYALHRVVQQVMRDRQAAGGQRDRWLAAACDLVNRAFPFDPEQPLNWPACEALLPHARAIREHAVDVASPVSLGRLLNQAGGYLRVRGLYAEAKDFRELALESALRQFGPDHPTVALSRSNLANILRELGEHGEARRQVELALESDLRQFGPDHRNVAMRRSNLANILGDLGEHGEARRQVELALESDLRQFGPDHRNVAVRRSNLANLLGDFGEHGEARRQIELALESDLRQFGPDHPNVAVRRSNLANILGDLGEHGEAQRQIELALESDLRQFGPDHPNVAAYRSNLANILGDLGQHGEARRQIELALESALRQFGPDHPTVAVKRLNLAVILSDLGEHRVALQQIEQALDVFRRKLPEEHPHTKNAVTWREIFVRRAGA